MKHGRSNWDQYVSWVRRLVRYEFLVSKSWCNLSAGMMLVLIPVVLKSNAHFASASSQSEPTSFAKHTFRWMLCRSFFLLAFLLFSGDVELNPSPTSFTVCTLNIRSILHPLHSATISDFIDSHSPDLFCLTETWIKPSMTFTELAHCTPPNYSLLSFPRTSSKNTSSQAVGGSTGFLIHEPFTQLPTSHNEFSSFELSSVTLKLPHSKISVFNIYRPPSSFIFSKLFSVFLGEFNSFLSFAATTPHEFIITGDFNIHFDNHSDHATSQFLSVLSSFNLTQHVNFSTHNQNHILDHL